MNNSNMFYDKVYIETQHILKLLIEEQKIQIQKYKSNYVKCENNDFFKQFYKVEIEMLEQFIKFAEESLTKSLGEMEIATSFLVKYSLNLEKQFGIKIK